MANPSTILSKQQSNTDFRYRLAIPTMTLKDFPAIREGEDHVFMQAMDKAWRLWKFPLSKRSTGLFLKGNEDGGDGGDDGNNGGGGDGGDDGNNGGGGGGGSGGNNKKESRDREGDSNGDQDKRSRDMDFMCGAWFGYKFRYHAGYENRYLVGQLKCVQVVQ